MTDLATKWKSSKYTGRISSGYFGSFRFRTIVQIAAIVGCCVGAPILNAQTAVGVGAELPRLINIGVIPVQWPEGTFKDLDPVRASFDEQLSPSVSDTNRFRVLNDELVASLWDHPEGRLELVEQFELHAFFSLSLQIRADTILFTARLLSPRLDTYLLETDTYPRSRISTVSPEQARSVLDHLVYRLINRLPYDVAVTSIQGRFVTLSGGKVQRIFPGDELTIKRSYVQKQHPAHGGWINFHQKVVGKVRVIETKEHASVATVTLQTRDGSIHIGDGIKVTRLPSRTHFKQLAQNDTGDANNPGETIELTPIYPIDPSRQKGYVPKAGKPARSGPSTEVAEPAIDDEVPVVTEEQPQHEPEEQTEDDSEFMNNLGQAIDYGLVNLGIRMWSVSGLGTANASFLPANFAQLEVGRDITKDVRLELLGELTAGVTTKGSFTGFSGKARAYLKKPIADRLNWRFGAGGSITGLAVNSESYGGLDILSGSVFGGLMGTKVFSASSVDWLFDFEIRPLNIGEIGAQGSKHSIKSSMGMGIRLGGILNANKGEIEWGGFIETNNDGYSLSGSNEISYSDLTLAGTARVKF